MAFRKIDRFERKDCTLAFVLTKDQLQRFNELKGSEKQSDLLRSILFDWMNRKEEQEALVKELAIASI